MEIYPIDEGEFSYLAIRGDTCELKIGGQSVRFHLETAENIAGVLAGYVEDRARQRSMWPELSGRA